MRACLIALTLLLLPALAHAGLYVDNDAEPPQVVPTEKVYSTVLGLRGAAAVPKGDLDKFSPRAFYLRQYRDLDERRKDNRLSPADRANLGGCLIRLGRVPEAISVLRAGLASGHFLIHANLATAYFLERDYRQAIRVQGLLLKTWPTVYPGPRGPRLGWYRECERAFLQLMKLREQEAARRRPPGPMDLDPLFPRVKFVAADGKYQPGTIAHRYADELPPRAIDTVLQLCIWLPGDLRLFWMLGELLNAAGQVEWAHAILDSLTKGDGLSFADPFKDLRAHHAVLTRALPILKAYRAGDLPMALLGAGQSVPLPNLAPGAAGPAATLTAAWAPVIVLPELKRQWQGPLPVALGRPEEQPPATQAAAPLLNWRHIGASFGFGVLATTLIGLQWREWQRRRARRAEEKAAGPSADGEVVPARPGDERITTPPAAAGPS